MVIEDDNKNEVLEFIKKDLTQKADIDLSKEIDDAFLPIYQLFNKYAITFTGFKMPEDRRTFKPILDSLKRGVSAAAQPKARELAGKRFINQFERMKNDMQAMGFVVEDLQREASQ